MIRRLLALGALVLCLASAPPAAAQTSVLFRLTDSRLDEASGIGRGLASPGVYYVQNDSGDSARFFALDARTGRVRAVYTVPGAQNHDWEDLAVAPDARGVSSVWLADIGDNGNDRSEVQLYRVDEPHVDMSRYNVLAQTRRPDVWRLRYPSGPANAESLAVSPHGRAYIVAKAVTGRDPVYSVPARADPGRVQVVTRIGTITFGPQPSIIPTDLQVLATGAALSADGSTLVVRTYTEAYVWRVDHGNVAAAIRGRPTVVTLPLQPQGEGVCIVGRDLIVDSEDVGSDVYRVPLPTIPALPPPTVPLPKPGSPTPARSAPPRTTAAVAPSLSPRALSTGASSTHVGGGLFVAGGAVIVIAVLGVVVFRVRRRRPRA